MSAESEKVKVFHPPDPGKIAIKREIEKLASNQNEIFLTVTARGYIAPLNLLIEQDMNKDVAEKIYAEIMKVAHKMSRKFNFSLTKT